MKRKFSNVCLYYSKVIQFYKVQKKNKTIIETNCMLIERRYMI
ncbi:hypothetical protein [Candidatus Portiera aleyrodidarum]|nr:hypothetical protein [Candidatus Portiera aleyrodidarum]